MDFAIACWLVFPQAMLRQGVWSALALREARARECPGLALVLDRL